MPSDVDYDPENFIGGVALAGALALAFVAWLHRQFQKMPKDPWPDEIDREVRSSEARPVCTNCLFPHAGHHWICPHCGFPGGEYLTVMPYLQVFPLGEFFLRGVTGAPERNAPKTIMFVIVALLNYNIFAVIYWYWMVRRAVGVPIREERRPELHFEDDA